MPEWLKREGDNKDKPIEIKPEDIQKAMEPKLKEVSDGINKSIDDKLAPIAAFFADQKKEKEEAAARAAEAKRKENQKDLEVQPEDWITDPEGAFDKKVTPLVQTVQAQSAMLMRDKVLKNMDYYATDPTFAAKVDALIDAQPLANRSNSNVILNAYKSVHYDMQDQIKEGKIKSFASMASLSNNGTSNRGTEDKDKNDTALSEEEKRYARRMGLTEEQWVAGRRELEYV